MSKNVARSFDEPDWTDTPDNGFVPFEPPPSYANFEHNYVSIRSMHDEQERLQTFRNKWPSTAHSNPHAMASAGFYYIGPHDKVKCYACAKVLKNWEAGDDPFNEHFRFSPKCKFLEERGKRQFLYEHGMPSTASAMNDGCSKSDTFEQSRQTSKEWFRQHQIEQSMGAHNTSGFDITTDLVQHKQPEHRIKALGTTSSTGATQTAMPRYPKYSQKFQRVSTYKAWPAKVPVSMKSLVDAGLFYSGDEDYVKCFHCGNEIGNWQRYDDATTKHRDSNPKCPFIKQLYSDST